MDMNNEIKRPPDYSKCERMTSDFLVANVNKSPFLSSPTGSPKVQGSENPSFFQVDGIQHVQDALVKNRNELFLLFTRYGTLPSFTHARTRVAHACMFHVSRNYSTIVFLQIAE